MSNLSILFGLPVGTIGFLFLFWRRLREDYPVDHIFSFSFIVATFLLIGFFTGNFLASGIRASSIFTPTGLWFWLSFLLGVIGFSIGYMKFRLRFFETLEAAGVGLLFFFFVPLIISSIQKLDIKLLVFTLIEGSLILLFFFIDTRYKRFTWYKSGKVGFAGLTVLGLFFLLRCIVALINPTMISFIGKFDAIVSSIVSFTFLMTLYNLSEK